MTNSIRIGTIVTLLAHGVAGCNGSGDSPGPSPIPGPGIPAATTLVVFTESASGFSTTDLRTITDGNGRYRLDGFSAGTRAVSAGGPGYVSQTRPVTMTGETQFDIQLVRQ